MARPMICRKVSCDVTVNISAARHSNARSGRDCNGVRRDRGDPPGRPRRPYQVDAAARMGVSRQTFGNIIARAHQKVASALLGGKALRIAMPLTASSVLRRGRGRAARG